MNNAGIGTPYWYEWTIGIIECLKMLSSYDIKSVVLQSSDFVSLDDVVINYADGSITNIQVKHTDIKANLTYSFLDSNGSLIKKLANEWNEKKGEYRIREIQLVTNRGWGTNTSSGRCSVADFIENVYPRLKVDYEYEGSNLLEKNAIEWLKKQISFLGENQKEFVSIFSFRSEHDLGQTEEIIREEIKRLIGIDSERVINACRDRLFSRLRIWATSQREKPEITREDIFNVLCDNHDFVPQYDIFPEKPIFSSRVRFANYFYKFIESTEKKIVFLQGYPGSGKTNFVSYMAQQENSMVDLKFYAYLPVSKENGSYSDDEGYYRGDMLWNSILTQLRDKFAELGILYEVGFPIVFEYLSISEKRRYALEFLTALSTRIGKTIYLFIDGIDHAARSIDVQKSFLLQLPTPKDIETGIKIILVGQPINDKYPTWLIDNPEIEYIDMPALERDDVVGLLGDNSIILPEIDMFSLADTVISVIGNNALNVIFAVMELKKWKSPLSFEDIECILRERCLNYQIDKYYEWILNSIEKDSAFYKLETVFAFSSRKIPLKDIVQMCCESEDHIVFTISKFYPLVVNDEHGYYVFHNDVRLHFKNEIRVREVLGYVVDKIEGAITSNKALETYKYDVLFELLFTQGNLTRILELFDVTYIMNAALFEISLDKLSQQYYKILSLVKETHDYSHLSKICAISLCLSQFANCIRFYEKEREFVENATLAKKTKSEKYILHIEKDFNQIIDDTYVLLAKNHKKRGKQVYSEYLSKLKKEELLAIVKDDRDRSHKVGFICRHMSININECNPDDHENYADCIDGWLKAGTDYVCKKGIIESLSIRQYYNKSLMQYMNDIIGSADLDLDSFLQLESFSMRNSIELSIIIDLCVQGIYRCFPVDDIVMYINDNLESIKNDDTYSYSVDRLLGLFKAWFCIYRLIDLDRFEKLYDELLVGTHITKDSRGYKPAVAQKEMAIKVYGIYYGDIKKEGTDLDLLYGFLYFRDRYGLGSCHDSNSYMIISFLRDIFLDYSRKHPDSFYIGSMCDFLILSISQNRTRYIGTFNELFYIGNRFEQFVEWITYWCGEKGEIWNQDYSTVENCCLEITRVLELFGDNDTAQLIQERQKLKLFGYIDHKDYSLYCLLDFYNYISDSTDKLEKLGMRLLDISDAASRIGDNRTNTSIDKELFKVAVSLGNKYSNALFELKNNPNDFVYWRMSLLSALYESIDKICTDDNELIALYNLTNAWIDARYEADRRYGRIEMLREYNSIVISRVKDPGIKNKMIINGNCEYNGSEGVTPTTTYDFSRVYEILFKEGYDYFEDTVCGLVDERAGGLLTLFSEAINVIPSEFISRFTNKCVLKYIMKEGEYGFIYTGVREVLKMYYPYINSETWDFIYDSMVNRFADNNIETIGVVGDDMEIFTLFYMLSKHPDRIENVFLELCNTHTRIISANERLKYDGYRMCVNDNIESLSDLVKYQIGAQKVWV